MSKQHKSRTTSPHGPERGGGDGEVHGSRRNPVAKFDWRVNKASVQVDRKKAQARGYRKHRSRDLPPRVLAA